MPDDASTAPGGPLVAMVKGCLDLAAAQREEQRRWVNLAVRHADNVERRIFDVQQAVKRGDPWVWYRWWIFVALFIAAVGHIRNNQRDQLAELRAVRELLAAQAAQGMCDVP